MIRVERAGPVTTVVLDRPESRNAVDRETAAALAAALEQGPLDDEDQTYLVKLAAVAAGRAKVVPGANRVRPVEGVR